VPKLLRQKINQKKNYKKLPSLGLKILIWNWR